MALIRDLKQSKSEHFSLEFRKKFSVCLLAFLQTITHSVLLAYYFVLIGSPTSSNRCIKFNPDLSTSQCIAQNIFVVLNIIPLNVTESGANGEMTSAVGCPNIYVFFLVFGILRSSVLLTSVIYNSLDFMNYSIAMYLFDYGSYIFVILGSHLVAMCRFNLESLRYITMFYYPMSTEYQWIWIQAYYCLNISFKSIFLVVIWDCCLYIEETTRPMFILNRPDPTASQMQEGKRDYVNDFPPSYEGAVKCAVSSEIDPPCYYEITNKMTVLTASPSQSSSDPPPIYEETPV